MRAGVIKSKISPSAFAMPTLINVKDATLQTISKIKIDAEKIFFVFVIVLVFLG